MNWKAFIIIFVSAVLISFPQNIIGCGPEADPYDYYTSFFHPNLPEAKGYNSFYYTGYNFLYDENEPVEPASLLAKEWSQYCGNPVTAADAKMFVNDFARPDVYNLYNKIEKNAAVKIPDSVLNNSMTVYFTNSKNLEALGYILYAKKTAPYVAGTSDSWEPVKRDSTTMAALIKNGQQLYKAARTDLFKLKYGYQLVRLAQYSNQYEDAIKYYDEYIAPNPTNSVLQPMALALKAGALSKLGNKKEAAYLYSKAFSASAAKRVSNYISFKWMIDAKADRNDYLALCKNNKEKADMLSLFAMGSIDEELETMKKIVALDASGDALEVLVVREINKLEEKYFTPLLQNESAGNQSIYSTGNDISDAQLKSGSDELQKLSLFLHAIAGNKKIQNRGLFETGAAYASYMMKDYATAKKYLSSAQNMALTQKVNDQWMLTNLLVTISEQARIDTLFEDQLLPSLQWLLGKATAEKSVTTGYFDVSPWKKFYRNLMSDILAPRYHRQGDHAKETLCMGAADFINAGYGGYNGYFSNGVDFLRNHLSSQYVEKLYRLMNDQQAAKFERYFLQHNVIKKTDVIDFAGTAYLRNYDYGKAISWFKKQTDKKSLVIHTNPFVDLLYDQEEALPGEAKFITTKTAFAEEMQKQLQLANTDKANAAKHLYKIANGMYNMTYYGHAWQLVQYGRSGSDGYYIPKDATTFQKEYYGCYSALQYFEKAMNTSTDNNFKARCLFMMAKCSQKQVQSPQYFAFKNYDKYDEATKSYHVDFYRNKYFPALVKQYNKTPFYQEAYNSCSYLKDFATDSH